MKKQSKKVVAPKSVKSNKSVAKPVAVGKSAKKGKKDSRPVIGKDAKGNPVHVGDHVNHVEKPFSNGVVLQGGFTYKDEPAVAVLYPQRDEPWLNRCSKLAVVTVH